MGKDFPSVPYPERDRLYHYANKLVDRDHKSRNEELVKRWQEIVTPETFTPTM